MKLRVEGLSGELEDNVEARLSIIEPDSIEDTPQFRRYVEAEIKKALRALGYYSPTFSYKTRDSRNGLSSKQVFEVHVDPGRPILIERVSVNITGEGQNDRDYTQLLRNQTPSVGDVLNHGTYDSFKRSLLNLALRKGYFDADLTRHQLAVSDKTYQGFWRLDMDTGERYRFGNVHFEETPIREEILRNIIPFTEGEYYTSDQLALFSRRLSATNWFSSVTTLPDFSHVGEDKTLPVNVVAIPRKTNLIDVGAGYSTGVGVRGKLNWTKPWINDSGHSFQSNLALSRVEPTITASYKMPLMKSPLEDYYLLQGGYKREDNNDTDSNSYTFGAFRYWDTFEGWQKAIGLNINYDRFTQADVSYNTFLFYPSVSFSRIRSNGGLLPMWGDSQRYSVEVGSKDLLSDVDFWSFKTQQVWIRSLYDTHRFVARVNFGFIETNEFERLPPSMRFFAGGDRSIRGYSYQSISPEDSKGKLTGASRLLTGSIEYQYNFSGAWWGAAFVDSGEAINSFDNHDFHTGGGIGIRWVSPIGPIKMDVATPLDHSSSSIHFYIGLGAEL
ncbi:outer membrane protein assembly factor [Zophobihabitans entericus]|uniref:Translocation and assembly module subunit TamA n=2 Tax=Zophobihabitans entericus TaxID=1635327 RepID=A0A6G9IEZ4_9GAMM|nr:outer membrane protein assembly factor [Zophobihabitans entericus]